MTAVSELFAGLKDLGSKPVTCSNHGAYQSQGSVIRDRESWTGCPGCEHDRAMEEQRNEFRARQCEREQARLEQLLGRSGVPQRFADRDFAGYVAENPQQRRALSVCQSYANDFENRLANGSSLILCGLPGTGKTHLACAIANQVLRVNRRSVVFARVFDAIRTIKATWGKGSQQTEGEAVNSFIAPDLLILDEAGVQFGSDSEKMLAFEIINGRYEAVKPTILLSNLPITELNGVIGDRVMDRLREGGGKHVAFDWGSHRGRTA